jgi:phosphatidylserine/phosphatidylglycerophosphate/cardiolipin synthase-like enzyme
MNKNTTFIGKNLGKIIEKEFHNSEKLILISSPAISLSIWKIILKILKKGVKIKIITSEKGGSNSDLTNQEAMKILNDKNNEITGLLEYKIIKEEKSKLIHPKIYIIDNKCAIVGSANLTENGFYNYVEFIQLFKDENDIKIIEKDYQKLWKLFEC